MPSTKTMRRGGWRILFSSLLYLLCGGGEALTEDVRLVAPDSDDFWFYGSGVSQVGNTLLIGAYGANLPGIPRGGKAYLYIRQGTGWALQQELVPSDVQDSDGAGVAVVLDGEDTAIISASSHPSAAGADSGAVYVFKRIGAVWTQQQEFTASDVGATDNFGISLAISGDTLVVGSNQDTESGGTRAGSAYVFVRSGGMFTQQQKLIADDASPGDSFGADVSISGDTIAVGAPLDNNVHGADSGSVYVFTRTGTVWTQQQRLMASDGNSEFLLGQKLSIVGDMIAAGADDNTLTRVPTAGAVYIYTRSNGIWSEHQKVTPSDGAPYFVFGQTVQMTAETLLVGASGASSEHGNATGAAYVFRLDQGLWVERKKLTGSNSQTADLFGSTVSIYNDTAIVGAWIQPYDPGVLYIYELDFTNPTITMSTTAGEPVNAPILLHAVVSEQTIDFFAPDISVTNATVSDFTVSGNTYDFVLHPIADGPFSAAVNAGVFTDAAGNPNEASNTITRTYDSQPPTVNLTSSSADPVNGAIDVEVLLGEPSTAFTSADITADNSTISAFAGSGDTYSFTLTPIANGLFSAVVHAGAFADAAGNANTESNMLSRTYDTTPPGITLGTAAQDPVNAGIAVTVLLTKPSATFEAADITPTNASVSSFTGSGGTYSFLLTPVAEGTFGAVVQAGVFTDALGNANTVSNTLSRNYDATSPGITLSSLDPDPVAGAITVSAALSEASTNFVASDVIPINATISGFTGTGASYSFTVAPISSGTFGAVVNAGTFADFAGNINTLSNVLTRTFSVAPPGITLSTSAGDPVNGPITISALLGKPSVNFDAGDITVVNASVSEFSGSGDTYTFVMTPLTGGPFSAVVGTGTFTDNAGNGNTASNTVSRTFDQTAPTVVLSSAAGDPVPGAIAVNVVLSKPSSTFVQADVVTVNATVSGFMGSGTTYSFTLTPVVDGVFSAKVDAGAFTDAAGNANTVSNVLSRSYDHTAPSATLSTTASDPTGGAITVNVVLTNPSTNFTQTDISTANAGVSAFTGSGSVYSFTLTPVAAGLFSAVIPAGTFTDAAGNPSTMSNTLSRTYDQTSPGITLSTAAADPANGAITVMAALTKPSTTFTSTDISATNAAVSGFSGSGSTYSFTLTPGANGTFGAIVNAGMFTDAVGNGNTASNTLSRVYDGTKPGITLTAPGPSLTNAPVAVTATLTEGSSDFSAADITPANATISGFTGNGVSYAFLLAPVGDGVFGATVQANVFSDAAGNENTVSNSISRTYDGTKPKITNVTASPNAAPNGQVVTISFKVSEALLGNPQVLVNGRAAALFSGPVSLAYAYRYPVTGADALGPAALKITAIDLAGNGGVFENPNAFTVTGALAITQQPHPALVNFGENATFQITASGSGTLTYRWKKNDVTLVDGADYLGTNTPALTVISCANSDEGAYRCEVSAGATVSSQAVTLTVNDPIFLTEPQDMTVAEHSDVTLSAQATGTGTLTYQWFKNGIALAEGPHRTGTKSPDLKLFFVDDIPVLTDEGIYHCEVHGQDPVPLVSRDARLIIGDPSIVTQPVSKAVPLHSTVTFHVDVVGTQPIFYRWQKNGLGISDSAHISGAKTDTLTIIDVTNADLAGYNVVVVGREVVRSAVATLSIGAPPVITALTVDPASGIVPVGGALTLTIAAQPASGLSYQWFQNNSPISVQNPLIISSAAETDSGSYYCVVTNTAGSATSRAVQVHVGLTFTRQPQPRLMEKNDTLVWETAVAGGTGAVTLQWLRQDSSMNWEPIGDDSRISGSNTTRLTIANLEIDDSALYRLEASDSLTVIWSDAVRLEVVENLPAATGIAMLLVALALSFLGVASLRTWTRSKIRGGGRTFFS